MEHSLWQSCLSVLEDELPAQQFSMWIRPLQCEVTNNIMTLYAPNRFVLDWVREKYISRITQLVELQNSSNPAQVRFDVGSKPTAATNKVAVNNASNQSISNAPARSGNTESIPNIQKATNVRNKYTFDNFVEGKSNQLARAAASQVADNPGTAYNPLFIYGGTGLGKTHLLHAVGNGILRNNPKAKIAYMHSERFVQDMVKALQNNEIEKFKTYYRGVDALLIDDIQFFANKERTQEEFFHTFNALLEGNQQIILTSDRYPKEIIGVEDRLESRFGWGLTLAIEPPELETRVAL